MRIITLTYETAECSYEAMLSNDTSATFVISKYEMETRMFAAAIELALFKITDDPCGYTVKRSCLAFADGIEFEYPLGQSNKERKSPYSHQQFLDHVVGQNPVDMVEYARGGEYTRQTNEYLKWLAAGRMVAIRWDSNAGMVVEHQNGTEKSIFAMSSRELAIIKLAARLVDFQLKRYPFQTFTYEFLGLLDSDHMARFHGALLEAFQPDSQIVLLGKLMDVLGSPLTEVAPNALIIDLDCKELFDTNEEEGVSK